MKGLITAAAVLVVIFFGFLLYSSPAGSPGMTEAEMVQIEAEVLEAAQAWMDVWEDMDTDCERAAELWHPEHMAYFSGGERTTPSTWVEVCHRVTRNRAGFSGSWTDTDVRVLSRDAALFVGRQEGTFEHLDGSPTRHYPTGAQVILFERTETGWGITTFSNFNGPPEEVGEGGQAAGPGRSGRSGPRSRSGDG